MEVNTSTELRKNVAKYINKDARRRSLDEGLELLQQTGYKPSVLANFIKNKARRDVPQKLEHVLRTYLRFLINPSDSDHQDVDGKDNSYMTNTFSNTIIGGIGPGEYPDAIKAVVIEYSDLYKFRSITHKEIKQMAEDNLDETVAQREKLAKTILGVSHRLEMLWQIISDYKENGTIPTNESLPVPFDPETWGKEEKKPAIEIELAQDLIGLKKQKDNWRIKISKSENKLLYQSEKKLDKENPMPKGPKRLALEKKIERLKAEKELIEYAIVEKS